MSSYLMQARAARLGGQRGYRLQSLTAVSNAAAFRPTTAGREPVWSQDGTQLALANAEGAIYLQCLASGAFQTLIGHAER